MWGAGFHLVSLTQMAVMILGRNGEKGMSHRADMEEVSSENGVMGRLSGVPNEVILRTKTVSPTHSSRTWGGSPDWRARQRGGGEGWGE